MESRNKEAKEKEKSLRTYYETQESLESTISPSWPNQFNPFMDDGSNTTDSPPSAANLKPNLDMWLDIWVSCDGSPYQRLTIKNKLTVNQLKNVIGAHFGIPPGLLSLYNDHRLVPKSPPLEIRRGSFIQAELGLHGGGTGKRASTDNTPTGEPDKSEQDQVSVLNKMNRLARAEENEKQNDPSTNCTQISRIIPSTGARETNSSRIESECLTSEKAADQIGKEQSERWVDVEDAEITPH